MSAHNENLPIILTRLALAVAMVVMAIYAFISNSMLLMMAVGAAAPVVALLNKPRLVMILCISLFPSNLVVPGLPSGLQFVHLLMLFFIGQTVAQNVIVKPRRPPMRFVHYALYAMLVVVGSTIYIRGLGLKTSGGDLIGGAAYIRFFAGAGFLLCARQYTLTVAEWRKCFFLIVLGSALPVIAQFIFVASGGAIYHHFVIIQPYVYGLVESLTAAEGGGGIMRYHSLSGVGISLLGLGLVFMPFRGIFQPKFVFMMLTCLALSALSGFRISIMEILGTTALFILLSARKGQRLRHLFSMGAALLVVLAILIPVIGYLPLSVQRSLSWLPFVPVSSLALTDASDSTAWRVEVWKYSMQYWKTYAWVGRGFTVSLSDIFALSTLNKMITTAFAGHNYHSGPISMLLDLGVVGFITGSAVLLSSARYALNPLTGETSLFLQRMYTLYRAKMIYLVVSYYAFFGDVKNSFVFVFINLAILESIRASVESGKASTAPVAPSTADRKRIVREAPNRIYLH